MHFARRQLVPSFAFIDVKEPNNAAFCEQEAFRYRAAPADVVFVIDCSSVWMAVDQLLDDLRCAICAFVFDENEFVALADLIEGVGQLLDGVTQVTFFHVAGNDDGKLDVVLSR